MIDTVRRDYLEAACRITKGENLSLLVSGGQDLDTPAFGAQKKGPA